MQLFMYSKPAVYVTYAVKIIHRCMFDTHFSIWLFCKIVIFVSSCDVRLMNCLSRKIKTTLYSVLWNWFHCLVLAHPLQEYS